MSLQYIKDHFNVPAVRGARVATKELNPRTGTIIGARGTLLRVRIDGVDDSVLLHARKDVHYLPSAEPAQELSA
ncbi:hypothetical protein [Arthrobacter sp. zg-Y1110]|uniref:hypothetical protein n=1 Tax=Arthrobacter sp. zg-Y1110 TaxID=2886932 RepID=UPI001D1401EC|nr:hypothetical protein [Arthrobacter sp. zg-Y1110]MCC3292526.1 hypothetical protein [Arthrobacter sp. zg-Y1110]UWX87042.1 hypothetical protein N2K99_16965 [Arthrobacter sp. zg-Y1110]